MNQRSQSECVPTSSGAPGGGGGGGAPGADGGGGAAGAAGAASAVGAATDSPALATASGGTYSAAVTPSSPGTDDNYHRRQFYDESPNFQFFTLASSKFIVISSCWILPDKSISF